MRQLPSTPAEPPADARAWLDAFCLAVVCRRRERVDRLCEVPLEVLRQDDSVDEYVLHRIDTLQTYWFERPMDDVVKKLLATMETSAPDAVARAPKDFVNRIDYQPVALFHRLVTRDHDAFAAALAEALRHHGEYWGDSAAPRAGGARPAGDGESGVRLRVPGRPEAAVHAHVSAQPRTYRGDTRLSRAPAERARVRCGARRAGDRSAGTAVRAWTVTR
ncbi:immunity 49 family protein [Streptomyces sp. ISL-96]|uniref:immunity 49 family protein n=1 Tax=Streptomyces sp. ISL-96 TaxID=2819191 RepID=UPI0027E30948|nr:immunity 49 family protein [Streptomyces sp. ISL-96]